MSNISMEKELVTVLSVFDIIRKAGSNEEFNEDGAYTNQFLRGLNKHAATFKVQINSVFVLFSAHTVSDFSSVSFFVHPEESISFTNRERSLSFTGNQEKRNKIYMDKDGAIIPNEYGRNETGAMEKKEVSTDRIEVSPQIILNAFIEKFEGAVNAKL